MQRNSELLSQALHVLQVLLVLVLVLDLGPDACSSLTCRPEREGRRVTTFEDAHGGGEVVDAAGGPEGGGQDLDGGDEIVGEAVVEVALDRCVSVRVELGGCGESGRPTWSSKTSWTESNSFSYLWGELVSWMVD